MSEYKLNQSQKEAVEYTDGPLLIVAGAGTGKTTVIVSKIAYLIEKKLAKPEEILAVTFTDKATGEMVDRVDNMLDLGYVELEISTFHAFCQKILEQYGLEIGLNHQFKLLTQTDAWLLVRQNLDKFNLDYYRPLGNPTGHIHALLKHFSKCKDELISPEQYLKYAEETKLNNDNAEIDDSKRLAEIANAYHVYNQLLLDNNALDFGDLIYYTVKLLETRPNILHTLQERFKFILVDEFQDVNWSQYQLIQMLTSKNTKLTVVGDDDQSIYAFRGASVSNIMRFKEDYPNAKEVILNENYRSEQEILNLAYKSIQNNNPDRLEAKLKIDKKLISKNKVSSKNKSVIQINTTTSDEEVRTVVEAILQLKKENKDTVWDDFAILVRANSYAEPFINALEHAKIPYEFLSSVGLYRQPLVLDCFNYFKILDNQFDSPAMYRLLNLSNLQFPEDDMHKIVATAKRKSWSYYETIKHPEELKLSATGQTIVDKLLQVISGGMQLAKKEKPTTVLYNFLEEIGYLSYLTHEEEQGNRQVIRQIYQLKQYFEYISKYETTVIGAHIRSFVEHCQFLLEAGDEGKLYQPTDTPDSINILTIHGAKGLEYKYVFIVNLVEDRFPSRRRSEPIEIPAALIKEQLPEGDSHIQEERRLFYVAITRAKEKLYLTNANDYGGVREKKISRFLDELGFGDIRNKEKRVKSKIEITTTKHNDAKIESHGEFAYELPAAFSFSQIKSYETCPYQYKLAHILKIPVRGSASFSFGQTIHNTMHKFYQRLQELNTTHQESLFKLSSPTNSKNKTTEAPSLDELLKFYDESWLDDWYKDKKQKEDYYKKGKEILQLFYKSQEDRWTVPITLEGWFKIKVGKYLVHGRIDRIDQLPDGSLEIIDYKTGKSKEKVSGDDKDQLLIYQIAANTLPEYQVIGPVSQLTFYYVNDNIRTSFLGSDKELEKLTDKLINTIDKINSKNFTATPSQFSCDYCDFREICEHRA